MPSAPHCVHLCWSRERHAIWRRTIQVDEIAIFAPTAEQLETVTADAYSWIDQRGLRLYVGDSQLVAENRELLMEISDIRCINYEAALPQSAEQPLKSLPYGEMAWKLDIDRLSSVTAIPDLSIPSLVDLALFKKPESKVLDYGSHYTHETLLETRTRSTQPPNPWTSKLKMLKPWSSH